MSVGSWLPIRYRDFYDVPRLVVVKYHGCLYIFDSPFDDELDDYADHFTVYRQPESAIARLDDPSWAGLSSGGEEVGRVAVADVEFDETKRESVSDSVFTLLGIR